MRFSSVKYGGQMFGAALTVGASRKEAFSGGSKKRGAYRNNKTRRKHITCGELAQKEGFEPSRRFLDTLLP